MFKKLRTLKRKSKKPNNEVLFAHEALKAVLDNFEFETVLDIGSGSGLHKRAFEDAGKRVCAIDFGRSIYFEQCREGDSVQQDDYTETVLGEQFDLAWASHVLEHQLNPHSFLRKIHDDLKENGVLAITVPPMKHQIVGGHVSLWNAGILLYHLVLAGFDCRQAHIKQYGYNISVILIKRSISLPTLDYDSGDIDRLKPFFPEFVSEGFNGDIREYNWPY